MQEAVNAVVSLVLAILFYAFFMASKHDPALAAVAPFVEDPYDAVGSFAIQAAILLGILSWIRAFRRYGAGVPSGGRKALLARTEMAVVLLVLVTLAANAVAMARHQVLWIGTAAALRLIALQCGMALLALLAGLLIWTSFRRTDLIVRTNGWTRAIIVALACVLVLAFYPEDLRQSTAGALFTVVVGAVLLFAPVWALGTALLSNDNNEAALGTARRAGWLAQSRIQWGIIVLLVGLFLVVAETGEGGSGPIQVARLAFVAVVYVGLETTGLLIGYAFLRRWLGLFR